MKMYRPNKIRKRLFARQRGGQEEADRLFAPQRGGQEEADRLFAPQRGGQEKQLCYSPRCFVLENKHECEEYDFTSTASPDEDNEEELGKRKKKQKLFQDCVMSE